MSEPLAATALWGSLVLLVYAYLGYPLLLALASTRQGRQAQRGPGSPAEPSVSVVVAAFNEQEIITAKVANTLRQLGPADELIVVSDASSDATDDLVAHFDDPRVRLCRQSPRQGKNIALNLGVRQSRSAVLVFTDAPALLGPGALGILVTRLADPAVGLASGQGYYGRARGGDLLVLSNAYVTYESFIRRGEAAHGFLAGVDGALYAMRRELFEDLPPDQVHDLLHPIQAALAGHRVAFEPLAYTVEPSSPNSVAEWRRQVRMIAQGFRVVATFLPQMVKRGRLLEAWMLISHRVLRWSGWLLALTALVSNAVLLDSHPVYRVTALAQAAFFLMAIAGGIATHLSVGLGRLAAPYYFCLVSCAGFVGFVEALRGRVHSVWASGGRST